MIPGYELANDGALALPSIYPDTDAWSAIAPRLLAKAIPLTRSIDEGDQAIGFFLFGMAERASGSRTLTRGRVAPCSN